MNIPGRSDFKMVAQLCHYKLAESVELVLHKEAFMTTLCWLNIVSSLVTVIGNLVVIFALWKSSSITISMKALFLNLAVSDLAVGLLVQQMFIAVTFVMLKTEQAGHPSRFDFLCPITMTMFWFLLYLFAVSSFLSVAAIAVDRLLAVSLHLRYSQLITLKNVVLIILFLWTTSAIGATVFILLPRYNDMVAVCLEFSGLLATSVAYFYIYRVARRHRNQIQSHLQVQSNNQTPNMARVKKSTNNAFYVHIIFILCWLPSLISFMVKETYGSHIIVLAVNYFAGYIVFLHSTINPLILCWRYRGIRQRVISTFNKCSVWNREAVNARLSVSTLQG